MNMMVHGDGSAGIFMHHGLLNTTDIIEEGLFDICLTNPPFGSFENDPDILFEYKTFTTTYSYNEQNRLEKMITNEGSETVTVKFTYDNNGNMLGKSTETVKPADPLASGNFSLYRAGTTTGNALVFYRPHG